MGVQVVHCPSCGAPLHPTRFARTTPCDFCGATVLVDPDAVPRARFRRAFAAWNDARENGWDADRCVTVAERSWQVAGWLAQGDHAEVFAATLARHPTERVVLKVAAADDRGALERQARALSALAASSAPGADTFQRRVPAVVARGVVAGGPAAGRAALLLGWPSGFVHTFEDVAREYPAGIPPEASVWMWRRVLEALSFVHRSGWVHGALVPRHLLVHAREHGVLPVGWSRAFALGGGGDAPGVRPAGDAPFVPDRVLDGPTLDLAMLARCLVHVLGGSPARAALPASVPAPLAELVLAVAAGETHGRDAWTLREHVGQVARGVFGPPRFIPFAMPGW